MAKNPNVVALECLRLRVCRLLAMANNDAEERSEVESALAAMPIEAFDAADSYLRRRRDEAAVT